MGDYISREALKSKIRAAFPSLEDRCRINEIVNSLPAADVRPVRWIRTSERMPEEGGKYLCVWQGKSIDTGYFLNGHFRLYGEIKDHLVSHWMPLPELPHCGADMRPEGGAIT